MRNLCGLIVVVVLGAGSVSAAELSTATEAKAISAKSTGIVGDQALNLKIASKIDDAKNDVKQAKDGKTGNNLAGKIEQTSARVETSAILKTSSSSSAKPKVLKPVNRRILVFKATWCSACTSLDYQWPSMKKVGWRVGEKLTDHIQLVDSDERPDLVSKYGITALPTLVLVDDDKELNRRGSLGARNIAEFYYGRLE
jgi:thiol-disulfide isomerase/thioredoxin